MFCVCTPVNHSHPVSLLYFFYHMKLFCMIFFSFCFKESVTPLFMQLFCNKINLSSKNEGADIIKTVQLFNFHFIQNFLRVFKVINWKLWEQALWMTVICVIRNLWLIMATYCIFLKVSVFELTILTISVVLNVWILDFS